MQVNKSSKSSNSITVWLSVGGISFLFLIFVSSLPASAETSLVSLYQEGVTNLDSQGCLYYTPVGSQPPGLNLPLDVIVLIDESDTARSIDPALLRYQLLHLIANFLLVDGTIRGVENRLSVWVYASDTIYVGGQEVDRWKRVSTATMTNLEGITSRALPSTSYVNFNKLFDVARDKVISARSESWPLVLLINDPFPNGHPDERESDFARIAREKWLQIAEPHKNSLYMLDFTAGMSQSFAQREAVRKTWRSEFFTEDVHGRLLPVTEYNKISIVARVIEEVVEQPLFFPLTGSPPQLHVPPLAERITFGFIYNDKVAGSEYWTPTAAGNSDRASIVNDRRYIRVYKAENPTQIWNLPPNHLDRGVMYSSRSVGGLEQLEISANPLFSTSQYYTVQAIFTPGGSANPVLKWGIDGSANNPGQLIRHNPETVTYMWRVGPVSDINQPTELKISLESLGKHPFTCSFNVFPVPELKIRLASIEPLKVEITVSDAERLSDSIPNPRMYIVPLNEVDSGTELKVVASNHIDATAIYIATHNTSLDNSQSSRVVAELITETKEGLPISLRDTIIISPTALVVTGTLTPPYVATPTATQTPTPPLESQVPRQALAILGFGTCILAGIIFILAKLLVLPIHRRIQR
jgi:hypothetical protein